MTEVGAGLRWETRRWEYLAGKRSVPATLLLPNGEAAAEIGVFTVSAVDEPCVEGRVAAVASPELPSASDTFRLSEYPVTQPRSDGANEQAYGRSPRRSL